MSYGFNLSRPDGRVFFTTESTTWNFVDAYIVGAGVVVSRNYGVLSLISEVIWQKSFVSGAPDDQEAYICTVNRSGNTITATGGTVPSLVVILAR